MKLLILLTLSLAAMRAAAQSTFPIGNDEALMANTGVAFVGSPMGVYYNPALLATVENSSVSGSSSSFYLVSLPGNAGSINAYNSVPNSLVGTWKFENGSLGISLLTPQDLDLNLPLDATVGTMNVHETYEISQTTNLLGLTWGQRLLTCGEGCKISGGLSLFVSYSVFRTTGQELSSFPTGTAVSSINQSGTTFSLLPSIGFLLQDQSDFTWGIHIQAPAQIVKKQNDGQLVSLTSDNSSGTLIVTPTVQDAPESYAPVPQWQGAMGMQWRPNPGFEFLWDVNLAERSVSLTGSSRNHALVDSSIGSEYKIGKRWTVIDGISVDLSNKVGSFSDTEPTFITGTFSLGIKWKTEALESAIGAFEARNFDVQNPRNPGPVSFDSSAENIAGLIISGLYRFQ